MSRWTDTDARAHAVDRGCAPSGQATDLRAAAVREGIRLALGAGAAALLLAGWAGSAQATVDGIEFICPCELELHPATGEASVTFGVRNFRPTVTGALSVAFSVEGADGGTTEFPGRELVVGPLAPDAESRRFTRRWPGLSRFVEADASDPALAHGLLHLGETEADGGSRSVDRIPLLRQDGGVSEDAIFFRSPDFLTDSDGDGVADANERLEGTDPADPESAPGESTLDVLVLHNEGYASKFGYAPHTRIHHLMTLASLAYEDSGTNIRLRTVGIVSMEDEDGDWDDAEDWNTEPTVELLERVGRLHGADINVYFRGFPPEDSNFGPGGGFANLGGWRSRGYMTPPARSRFDAAIFYPVSAFVVAHEIGHVLGLDHPMQWGTVAGTFRWARGHDGRYALSTIMGSGGVVRFSDPDADCSASGCPYGAPRHEWDGADAVASLDAVRFQVARFRGAKPDADGDNIVDSADRFPLDAAEWRDTDGDGIGNRADPDDDNDNVPDGDDRFPLDPMEWADIDNDGIGDNADPETASEDALIPDPALRAIIEDVLELPPGAPIAAGDMVSIDDIQMPWNGLPSGERVRSLEGLQHAVSLHTLTLRHGDVSDLSPLSGLERLGWLDLSFNLIADVSPLVGMPSLRSVVLGGNAIADISPLAGMNQLEWLELNLNYLDDASLEWLGGLTGLHRLNLSNQQGAITDIAPLADLRRLEHLELSDNPRLYDIGTVSNFPELRLLRLSRTPVSDISALNQLTRLSTLSLSGTRVKDLDALTGLPGLSALDFAYNGVSDMAMFSELRPLSWLNVTYNQISNISALVDSPILADDANLSIWGNPLGREAIYSHVPLLEARGIAVRLSHDGVAPDERHVPDGRLRAALAEAAGKPGNADDVVLFDNDFRYYIRWLDLSGLGIEDLTGLEHASRLISVNLARNPIDDLSPLLGLASLRHVTLDAATLNGASFQRDIDALRARGVAVTSAETGQGMATADECRPGLLLAPGEDCVYPGTEERFTVDAGEMATFLFGAFGESVEIVGRIGGTDYDLAASRRDGGVWRIDRVAGKTDAPADDRTGSGGSTADSSPSFAGACFPTEIWYRDGAAIDPLTLPPAAGGDAPLNYSFEVIRAPEEFWELDPRPALIPGLAFDPATRRVEGAPINDTDWIQSYGLRYAVTDADGDTDELEFDIYLLPANSTYRTHGAMYDDSCDGFLTDAFTDSTGRTIRFRLQFGADWDLGRPRGVELYFHGNETGTETDMLDAYKYLRPDSFSLDKGMLRAAVASPYSAKAGSIIGSSLNNDGRRGWLPDDARLIHELLQSDFGGNAAIDRDRIVFTGDSQGPCFINHFLQRYAGVYGGGFHSDCGCLYWGSAWPPNFVNPWSPTVSWTPHAVSAVAPRFKVFVQSTTGDFLHDHSVAMRDLFRDVLGFETRWDLDAPGGHCAAGATPYGTVFEWLSDTAPAPRILGSVSGDHDVDGLADAIDPDDDNDGALDIVDALPLEPREWLDTDSDGTGDFLDRDADGDGVENATDPFPLDPLEWADNDGDGIGDNIDLDDDNDGTPDTGDPQPLHGPRNGQLSFGYVPGEGLEPRTGFPAPPKRAALHAFRPATVVYPEAIGHRQTYHAIRLGDGEDPVFEFMVDTYEKNGRCENVILPRLCASRHEGGFGEFHEERVHVIWVDRNRNRDLTDDGPPSVMADRALDRNVFSGTDDALRLGTGVVLNVPYGTGELLPYRLALRVVDDRYSDDLRLLYNVGSYWVGQVPVPGAEPVLVGTFDANLDGVFNTGTFRAESAIRYARSESGAVTVDSIDSAALDELRDYACVDLDRDGELNDCGTFVALEEEDEIAPMYPGEPFTLDGRTCTIDTAPTGHTARIDCQ